MAKKKDVALGPARASDPESSDEGDSLEEAIAKLTPEQAEMFMQALAMTMKKRRLMLIGNLLALLLMVAGMLWAFVAYADREPGRFTAWVFLVPFGSAGFCMWLFAKLAKHAAGHRRPILTDAVK